MRMDPVLCCVLLVSTLAGCAGPAPEEAGGGQAKELADTGSFLVTLDGREVHYEVHGTGPVVMTVPNSWGLSLEGLRGLYRPLESHVRLVYFNPRGMGASAPVRRPEDMGMEAVREDFHALREHLGLDRVHAIGWSNGAMNLILLAAERPDTLRTATFVHGTASFTPEDFEAMARARPELMKDWQAFEIEIAESDATLEEKTARMKEFWLGRYFPASLADAEESLAAVRAVFGPAEFSRAHADYTTKTHATFDVRGRLGEVAVPSLVIAGAADMFPLDKAREMADGLPDAQLVVLEESGHFGPIEQPERFREVVLRFWGVVPQKPEGG